MQLLDWSFLTFFIAGGALFIWFIILGALLTYFTPKPIKQFAFKSDHYTDIELELVSGFHYGALIHGVALITTVAFPSIGKKRKLSDIRSVCTKGFIHVCTAYVVIMLLLAAIVIISMMLMMYLG